MVWVLSAAYLNRSDRTFDPLAERRRRRRSRPGAEAAAEARAGANETKAPRGAG